MVLIGRISKSEYEREPPANMTVTDDGERERERVC